MMFRDFRILSIVQKIEVPSDTLVYLWDVSPTYIFSGNLMHRNTGLPMCCQDPSSLQPTGVHWASIMISMLSVRWWCWDSGRFIRNLPEFIWTAIGGRMNMNPWGHLCVQVQCAALVAMGWLCSPKFICRNPTPPHTYLCDYFGDKVFKEVINVK